MAEEVEVGFLVGVGVGVVGADAVAGEVVLQLNTRAKSLLVEEYPPTSRFFRARSSWTTSRSTTRNTFRNNQPQNLSKMSNLVWSQFWSQFSGLKKLGHFASQL